MKKKYLYIFSTLIAGLTVACNEEPFAEPGTGSIVLSPSISSDLKVVTRADEDSQESLKESCMVWISNDKGLVRRYNKGSEIPTEAINLVSGEYVAEAWAGDSVPASFEKIWYKGISKFEVVKGATTPVVIECKIANVAASVKYDNNISNVLKDYYMTIGHKGEKLLYKDDTAGLRGYFMMPSYDKDLSYELKGKQIDGTDFTFSGVIENVEPATEYVLNVVCEEKTNDVGGAIFTIKVDTHEIVVENKIEVVAAPKIQGYDFALSSPIVAEAGKVGRKTIYVSSATEVNSLVIDCDAFKAIPGMDGNSDVDLLKIKNNLIESLKDAGINFENKEVEEGQTLLQINFEPEFTNSLGEDTYKIAIRATDKNNRVASAVMTLMISDASVVTDEIDDSQVSFTSATIWGTVAKEDVEEIGFNYRKAGDQNWQYIEGIVVGTRAYAKNAKYYAVLKDLDNGATYEYAAVADGMASMVVNTFTTKEHLQLPNSSFEQWGRTGSAIFPGTDYNSTFWDTGNHGSTTLGEKWNLTDKSTDYFHTGNYSACLQTKYVVLKLGAGNIFAGKFLGRENTDGVTGFGRPFTDTPSSVKLWVKYTPGTSKHRKDKTNYLTNSDQGQIYIALTDDTMDDYKGQKWPFVVHTGEKKYFNKDDARVIAYGERNFTEATEGDGLIQIEIKLDYRRQQVPSNIIFVASASKYGDYYEGFDDSTMYLDDIELIYDDVK